MKKIVVATLVFFVSFSGFSQSKVGTIDIDYIMSKMPELSSVRDSLTVYGKKLDKDFNAKIESYQAKLKIYTEEAESGTLSGEDLKAKQDEIYTLEDDLSRFRQNGVKMLQIREDELKRPLYQKIAVALEKVAEEENFTQILGTDSSLIYLDPEYDITIKVMKELGLPTEE